MDVLATLSVKEFNSLCRFCTRKQKNLKPIFKEENDGGCFDFTNSCVDNGIVNMLSECTGLETTPTDGLPLFICTECHQKLLDSHSFRNQCIESVDKLKKVRLNFNNVKNEDDNSNDQDNTFFADTFADDDGWGQDESENFDDAKTGDCQIVVEPISNTKSQTSKRKPPAKRKAPAKRKSKVSAKRKSGEDQETSEDVKVELSAAALAESAAEPSVDELKPELDPVTGEIVMPTVAVDSQENKPNRKRDRTKGPKVKKEKKPYVRKPNKPEQCDICGFISRSLKSHMLVHTQERNFECDFCGKKFALRASLKNHIFAHINIRSHKCTICLLQFKTEKTLKRHRAIHTTEYNFVCEICHKKFLHKDRLREHLKIHAMRRYSCPYCSQYFSNTGGLRSHIGIHTGIKPYSCGVCDMTFVNTSSASVHRRTHLVGNVFQCEKCFSEFKHFRSFTIHKEACFLTPEQLTSTNTT